jgi:hypothetical protein
MLFSFTDLWVFPELPGGSLLANSICRRKVACSPWTCGNLFPVPLSDLKPIPA